MATEIINNAHTNGIITPVSGYSVQEYHIWQFGHVVWVKCFIQKSSGTIPNSGGTTHIATLSGVDLPDQNCRFTCGCGPLAYQASNACYGIIGPTGKLEVWPSVAASTIVLNFMYMVL